MDGAGESRSRLIFHPAGVFFTLAAVMAAALPWLWLLPLEDPRLAHIRMGLFGFGGAAILGYLMTAQKAWTGRRFPVPALPLGAVFLAARLASLCVPEDLWPVFLLLPIALMVAWPVLRARRHDKMPLALVPLALVIAEAMLLGGWDIVGLLPTGFAILVFVVGERLVRAFSNEARHRRGLGARRRLPRWLGSALLSVGLVRDGGVGALALFAAALWVAASSLAGVRLGPANRMLCLAYAGLVPALVTIAAATSGFVPHLVQVHALTMAAVGPMILAISARVTMRRSSGTGLLPRRRHWVAFGLVVAAAMARALAELSVQRTAWLTLAGLGWSTAWIVFLSVHVHALMRPTPFPLLSAQRYVSQTHF